MSINRGAFENADWSNYQKNILDQFESFNGKEEVAAFLRGTLQGPSQLSGNNLNVMREVREIAKCAFEAADSWWATHKSGADHFTPSPFAITSPVKIGMPKGWRPVEIRPGDLTLIKTETRKDVADKIALSLNAELPFDATYNIRKYGEGLFGTEEFKPVEQKILQRATEVLYTSGEENIKWWWLDLLEACGISKDYIDLVKDMGDLARCEAPDERSIKLQWVQERMKNLLESGERRSTSQSKEIVAQQEEYNYDSGDEYVYSEAEEEYEEEIEQCFEDKEMCVSQSEISTAPATTTDPSPRPVSLKKEATTMSETFKTSHRGLLRNLVSQTITKHSESNALHNNTEWQRCHELWMQICDALDMEVPELEVTMDTSRDAWIARQIGAQQTNNNEAPSPLNFSIDDLPMDEEGLSEEEQLAAALAMSLAEPGNNNSVTPGSVNTATDMGGALSDEDALAAAIAMSLTEF
ncbi:MAG: hypothetical protein KGI80_01980 [Verrucomicrobiota bacterium]|nr:hypothetical protein [Verrucomicrobiota bacterium]